MISLSARTHIALGLAAIVTTGLLLGVFFGLLPDRIRSEYGFAPLPPPFVRKALVAGGAQYVRRALLPVLPDRLRLVPAARAA